ncbi:ATPase [Pelagivirga sediminicola]|uniref:ATP synthase epsilon chain n=1 Tax=Pelagivirga sediminicola TaxID=2170575 RepID=A0A2T7G3H9_9RHOB|nr:ATPase [Pelagivirga sediminicola]PVA08975.1 ATPase [Pelagivirga sediminicola]
MSMATDMQVRISLPGKTLFSGAARQVNGVAENGGFGILPNHVDFVTAIVPSVLLVTQADGLERIIGVDGGMLVKKGHSVEIVVQRGVEAPDLVSLDAAVAGFWDAMEDEERVARAALSRLEADMVRRFAGLRA